jgi:predicted dehydrogenase
MSNHGTTARDLRIAVLGTASIARKNIRAIALASSDISVVVVASRDPERARVYCREVGLPESTSCCTYQDALNMDVNAVYIPLPTTLHLEWVVKAASAGKHILCEKPIAVDLETLNSIVSVCEEMNVELMDGVMFMHHPRLSTLVSTLRPLTPLHVSSSFTFLGDEDFFKNNIRCNGGDPLGCLGDLGYYNIRISLTAFDYTLPSHAHGVILEENEHGVPITMSCGMRWEDGRR